MALNVALLTESFERAKRESGGTTSLGMSFYKRLFEKYPSVKPLFTKPPEVQHKMLMSALATIVAQADQSDQLVPYLHALGIRHLLYKTENAHYSAVAENLLAVLREHLSKEGEWTDAMQETWTAAIALIVKVMMEASNNPEAYAEELANHGYGPNGLVIQKCGVSTDGRPEVS